MSEIHTCLSPAQKQEIKDICDFFNNDPGNLINALHKTQDKFGYLPKEIQIEVAKGMQISTAKVFGVVSFYSFFTMKPKGKHPISICTGTACYVKGAANVVDEFKKQLSISEGETTKDGKFSIDCLRCVGACGLAPVVLVGEKVYGSVQPKDVKKILSDYS